MLARYAGASVIELCKLLKSIGLFHVCEVVNRWRNENRGLPDTDSAQAVFVPLLKDRVDLLKAVAVKVRH